MKKSKTAKVSFADEISGSLTSRTCLSSDLLSPSSRSANDISDFSALCRFSTQLHRPRWEVKFPLVLPSPKPRASAKSLRPITEQRSTLEGSRPATEAKSRPNTTSLKLKSDLALQYIDSQCEAILSGAKRKLRHSTRELKYLRAGLKTTAKHIRLIVVSNNRAPYYVLRHKFQRLELLETK
jgi:hypothetical protein